MTLGDVVRFCRSSGLPLGHRIHGLEKFHFPTFLPGDGAAHDEEAGHSVAYADVPSPAASAAASERMTEASRPTISVQMGSRSFPDSLR